MARGRTLCSVVAAAIALLCCVAGRQAVAGGRAVTVGVVIISASGRGGRPQFDSRIPKAVQQQLKQNALAYSKYVLHSDPSRATPLGGMAKFNLPNGETLSVQPVAAGANQRAVHVNWAIRTGRGKRITSGRVLLSYGRYFLVHRPRGSTGLLIGFSVR